MGRIPPAARLPTAAPPRAKSSTLHTPNGSVRIPKDKAGNHMISVFTLESEPPMMLLDKKSVKAPDVEDMIGGNRYAQSIQGKLAKDDSLTRGIDTRTRPLVLFRPRSREEVHDAIENFLATPAGKTSAGWIQLSSEWSAALHRRKSENGQLKQCFEDFINHFEEKAVKTCFNENPSSNSGS